MEWERKRERDMREKERERDMRAKERERWQRGSVGRVKHENWTAPDESLSLRLGCGGFHSGFRRLDAKLRGHTHSSNPTPPIVCRGTLESSSNAPRREGRGGRRENATAGPMVHLRGRWCVSVCV